jgi:adenine-specific DNA-methyltransferase
VALTLARQRLMTAVFDYYELAHPHPNPLPKGESDRRPGEGMQGVWNGFRYKTVPHVTLKSIANNPEIDGIHARWQARLEPLREQLNRVISEQWIVDSKKGAFKPLEEWEIPREAPDDWPKEAKQLLADWWQLRRKRQEEIDAVIARYAPQETLYDQPFVDRKKVRVTGPFTVEAVPAPAVKSVDSVLGIVDSEAAQATIHNPLSTSHFAPTAARSGETLRQAEWRDELLRTGIRGKAGQYIRFARLEPLPGCRYLHADGEEAVASGEGLVDSKQGHGKTTIHYSLSTTHNRVVVSFGPEHAPLEQRQVEHA